MCGADCGGVPAFLPDGPAMSAHRIVTEDGVVIAETDDLTVAYRAFVNATRRLALKTVTVEYGRSYR